MKPELIVDAPIIGEKKIWVKKIYKPYFDHPFHFHKLCELTWIEKSHGKLIIGDYVGNFSEGEIVLSSPELPHLWKCDAAYYKNSKDLYTKAVGLYFPVDLINRITDETAINNNYNKLIQNAERGLRFYGETRKTVNNTMRELVEAGGLQQLSIFSEIIDILSLSVE